MRSRDLVSLVTMEKAGDATVIHQSYSVLGSKLSEHGVSYPLAHEERHYRCKGQLSSGRSPWQFRSGP